MLTLRAIAQALGGEISGGQVLAPGPGHSPKDRSLSIKLNEIGGVIVHSFAGDDPIACKDYVRERCGVPAWRPGDGNGRERTSAPISIDTRRIVAEYIYKQSDGAPHLRVQRTASKQFLQAHWNGATWISGKPQGPKIPYRLPELVASDAVYVVEGEKD